MKGRKYAEIGTQSGDLCKCLAHYAARVTAVERMRPVCRHLSARGIEVTCENLKPESLVAAAAKKRTLLPLADVYYWWMHPGDNKYILGMVAQQLEQRGLSATVFFGMDPHSDHPRHFALQLEMLRSRGGYRNIGTARLSRLFFDETEGDGLYPDQNRSLESQATYTTPYNGRPGKWGVFHVFSVELGPRPAAARRNRWAAGATDRRQLGRY